VLRVRGSTRDGQVVRLQSTKCTIGSGLHCTLRLRADNVGAVHCLILRGPHRTVVRRWSPDTRLNGRNFIESVLQAGDCLSIGAIELEVVETAQPGLPSENLCDRQLAEIQARLRSLDEQQAGCDATQAAFRARQSELDKLRAQWELQQVESCQQQEAREAELNALQIELDSARSTLDEERRQWESQHGEALASLSTNAAQHAAEQAELDTQRQALEEQQAAWEAHKAENAAQAAANAADLQRLRADLESAREAFAGECLRWESQHDEALTAQSTNAAQLAAQQAELDARRRALEKQQAAWEAQKAENAAQAAANAADLQRLRADFESAREAFAGECLRWESQHDEALTAQSTNAAQLAAQQAELDAQRRALDDRMAGLDALRVDLESQRFVLEKERRQWESQLRKAIATPSPETGDLAVQEAVSTCQTLTPRFGGAAVPAACAGETPAPQVDFRRAISETEIKSGAEVEAVRTFAPSNAAPVDLVAILQRTGFKIDPADEEEQSDDNVNLKNESSNSGSAKEPSIDISAPIPCPRKPVGPDGEEEVSIDEYMTRLLARSRGDSAPSSDPSASVSRGPVAASPAATPRLLPDPVVPETQSEPSEPGKAVEMAPRAVAAERQVDLQAMRQLANLSAKNALQKHESKRLSGNTRAKLLVTSVSVVAGVSLLVIYLVPGAPPLAIYGAVASLVVAALWGVRYVSLTSHMSSARMDHVSRHLKAGEEPAAEVKTES